MKTLLTYTLVILSVAAYCQGGLNYMVIDQGGVIMREGPGTEHKAIVGVPFNHTLEIPTENVKPGIVDTVNNLPGRWIRLIYGQHEGYVFNAYITMGAQRYNSKFPKDYPQIAIEQMYCGHFLYYNEDLVWHGLYKTEHAKFYKLIPIDITFDVTYDENFRPNDSQYHHIANYLKIDTGVPTPAEFWIGLPKETRIEKLYTAPTPIKYQGNTIEPRQLYPGEIIHLGSDDQKREVKLYFFGKISEVKKMDVLEVSGRVFEEFEAKVVIKDKDEMIEQSIDIKSSDRILFVGDINSDGVRDIILTSYPTWGETETKLFMSGYGDNVLTEVASTYWGACY